ncbi:MAG TPA: Ig-like domain repeat protein, partial [Elusimicrobiales bacterium]|nr:Ig-like domain repeat protein [Elusimicrobiales bacterium]
VSSGAFYRGMASIGGTASDASMFSAISSVELQIKDLGTDLQEGGAADTYWDGFAFDADPRWVPAVFTGYSSGTWTYDSSAVTWQAGRRYRLTARAVDVGDNHETEQPGPLFAVDRSSPMARLLQPANLSGGQSFPVISGTAGEGLGPADAGIVRSTHVQVAIQRLDDLRCWTGVTWQAAGCHPLWRNADFVGHSSGTWTYASVPSPADLTSGVNYLVLARAMDNTLPPPGNTQTDFAAGISSSVFFVDNTSGTAAVSFPAEGMQRSAVSLASGTVADEFSGVAGALLTISYETGGDTWYWDGAWSSPTVRSVLGPAGTPGALSSSWSYTGLSGAWTSGNVYRFEACAIDQAGNTQESGCPAVEWLFDQAAPSAGVGEPASNGGFRSPVDPLDLVSGTAQDSPSHAFARLDEVQVRIKNVNDSLYWNGSDWTASADTWLSSAGWNASSADWSVSRPTCPAEGVNDWCTHKRYDINVRAYDKAVPSRNLSQATTRYFYYDSTLPSVEQLFEPDLAYEDASSFAGNIYGEAKDSEDGNRSGVAYVDVAVRNPATGGIGNWWDGAVFGIIDNDCTAGAAGGCWLAASTGTEVNYKVPWNFTSTPTWTSNQSYRVRARVRDNAGNYYVYTRDFVYDNSGVPSVALVSPVNNRSYNNSNNPLPGISGTASDLFQVVSASIAVREAASKLCWSVAGSTFSIPSVADECPANAWYTAASLTGGPPVYDWNWGGSLTLQDHYAYQAKARTMDQSGKTNQTAFVTFYYDVSRPTSSVTSPAQASFIRTLASIGGTAVDDPPNASGVSGVQAALRRYDDKWWDGSDWTAQHAGEPEETDWLATACVPGSCVLPWTKTAGLPAPAQLGAGAYALYSRAYDVAKNTQAVLADPSLFTWDVTGPAVALTTPTAAGTGVYSAMPLIGGTAQDANNIVRVEFRVKHPVQQYWTGGSDFAGGAETWHVSSGSILTGGLLDWATTNVPPWTESNNLWTVNARALDAAGNYSAVYTTAAFYFDVTAAVV